MGKVSCGPSLAPDNAWGDAPPQRTSSKHRLLRAMAAALLRRAPPPPPPCRCARAVVSPLNGRHACWVDGCCRYLTSPSMRWSTRPPASTRPVRAHPSARRCASFAPPNPQHFACSCSALQRLLACMLRPRHCAPSPCCLCTAALWGASPAGAALPPLWPRCPAASPPSLLTYNFPGGPLFSCSGELQHG